MDAPEDPNGLREALARELIRAKFGEEGVAVLFGIPAEATPHQVAALTARVDQARSEADALIAGPLASLIADRASLRAAEAEITRLKEGMEARERANDRLVEMVEKLVLNASTGSVPLAIIVAAGDLLDILSQEHPHG